MAVIVAGAILSSRRRILGLAPVPGPPGAVVEKYSDALAVALKFFDVQKCNFFLYFKLLVL